MKDCSVEIETLSIGSKKLLDKTTFTISNGFKYAFIGKNGLGKTTIINHIYKSKELNEIHKHMVNQEISSHVTKTPFDIMLESNKELNDYYNRFKEIEQKPETDEEYLNLLTKLNDLEFEKEFSEIKKILNGLGFNKENINWPICKFSGGWRMRLALGSALYLKPDLLLLDEPTNHLDLEANIWLTEYLKTYKKTIIFITHDIDLIENISDYVIHLDNFQLTYYRGNYSKFKKAYSNSIKENKKLYDKITKKIKELKSNPKAKIELENYTKKNPLPYIPIDRYIDIDFGLVPEGYDNLITFNNLKFGYSDTKIILDKVNFNISTNSRICIVGKNGIGKSTILKLITGDLKPINNLKSGLSVITRDDRVRIGNFNQHTFEYLPPDKTAIEYLMEKYPEYTKEDYIRSLLGKINLENKCHKIPISNLSGGQKVRVVLVELELLKPHILLLDEPTNHLDILTIEALKEAINKFNGAVVIISHNIDFITDTNCIIYELENKQLTKTTFEDYCYKILE
jgi:ATP-binding cassette subfamily F protein 1